MCEVTTKNYEELAYMGKWFALQHPSAMLPFQYARDTAGSYYRTRNTTNDPKELKNRVPKNADEFFSWAETDMRQVLQKWNYPGFPKSHI